MNAQYRLGIDAGGTFTDFVIADRKSGAIKLFKALSTPSNPTKAIEDGLAADRRDISGRSPSRDRRQLRSLHQWHRRSASMPSSPIKGGKTGLICTAGHEI